VLSLLGTTVLVKVPEHRVLRSIAQDLCRDIERGPLDSLRLVPLPIVQHHPRPQPDDEDQGDGLDTRGDDHRGLVFGRKRIEEDVCWRG
jgi:hypothetical protein